MHPLRILSAPQTVTAASITQPQTSRAYPVLNNCCQPLSNTHTPKLSLYSSLFSLSSSLPYRRCHLRSNCVSPINMALDSEVPQDDRISRIASSIRIIPNFPKPGIMFQDITTMLLDPKAFKDTIDLFVERYKGKDISVVAGNTFSV
ncbi:hypothetical protein SOVF_203760 [Spinacia oleracea]|nr:hypothetical protein SOVF_203760 [Spinacia oleracea]